MKGKNQLFLLVIGMLLYILDLTSDVWLAIRYHKNDESGWFFATLSVLIIACIVTNMAVCLHVFKDTIEGPYTCLWMFCTCPILFRFVEEFAYWKQANVDISPCGKECQIPRCKECEKHLEKRQRSLTSTYSLTWLHLMQTLTGSAPQFCLQMYIMLNQWYFPSLTVISTLISFISLAWSITSLELARESKNKNELFNFGSKLIFLSWQIFGLISRLTAIVIVAHILRYYVFCVLGFHWFLVTMAIAIHRREEFSGEGTYACIFMLITLLFCVFPLLIFATEPLLSFYNNRRWYTFVAFVVFAIENTIMVALSFVVSKLDVVTLSSSHENLFWFVVAACVLGGLALETVFFLGYYRFCCSRKEIDAASNEPVAVEDIALENDGFNNC
ncbi:XK-related protein 8-like isoform X1 [Dendronephthya gigantea]|uniref:XK-related protein 8-like isoform X1 n=1 Tax=Dendronephthya gigantea TaxID=151771 RepID=UPI001069D2BC|nr:XK-related protein 8-like isoform X1 [Dendronephthya gigantea]